MKQLLTKKTAREIKRVTSRTRKYYLRLVRYAKRDGWQILKHSYRMTVFGIYMTTGKVDVEYAVTLVK